jgi:PiT family inorganic phosphate transporter
VSLLLLAATSFVFTANNTGMIRAGFQYVTGRAGLWYSVAVELAFVSGFLFEGYKVSSIFSGGIASLPGNSENLALGITLLVMVVFTLMRLPASISNVAVGSVLGAAIALSLVLNLRQVELVLVAWLVAPISSGLLATLLYFMHGKIVSGWSLSSVSVFNRFSSLLVIVFTSYTLAANNLGLLLGLSAGAAEAAVIVLAAVLGYVTLGRVTESTVGWKFAALSPTAYSAALLAGSLTLWVYTQLGVPASLTQTVVSGIMALSLYKRPSVVNSRTMFELVGSWPFFLVVSLLLAYLSFLILG